MVLKVNGLREKLSLKCIIGYSDIETVKLDFDYTPFKTVRYFAFLTLKRFKLGGFIILKSSMNCYHVVFDRRVSWSENMRIVAWVGLLCKNRFLLKWFVMQCIKEESTLRVSCKREKPSPRIVFRYGCEDMQIREFLGCRKTIKGIVRRLQNEGVGLYHGSC